MAENATMEAAAYTAQGTERDRVSLPEQLFDGTINMPVMHQAVKAYLANQRQGNASTKIRKYVTGGNRKPWKQKGTGRARQGSIRAPQWVGGGTVFGPQPRSYAQYVPRQVRALARKSAFNARAREASIRIVDRFAFDSPKTRRIVSFLDRLDLTGRKVLILTDGVNRNVYLSARNLQDVQVLPYSDVSAYHILWSDVVVIEGGAIGQTLEPVTEESRSEERRPKRAKKTAAPVREEEAETGEEPAPRRGTAKAGARKKAAAKRRPPQPGQARKVADRPKAAAKKKTATKAAAKKSPSRKPSTSGGAGKPKGASKSGKPKKKGK